jgi:hypothetical protein
MNPIPMEVLKEHRAAQPLLLLAVGPGWCAGRLGAS